MFDSMNSTTPNCSQAPIDAQALPLRVTVVNPDLICIYNHNYFKRFPINAGDVIVLTSKADVDWFNFHTLESVGSGKPSGIVYIKAFTTIEAK